MMPSLSPADIPMDYSPKEFRVWDTKLNKFIPWNSCIRFDDPDYVIQQKTGKKDRLGNALYEGDIVKLVRDDWTKLDKIARVVFFHGMWCLMYKADTELHVWYNDFEYSGLVGNIFETPNLLL